MICVSDGEIREREWQCGENSMASLRKNFIYQSGYRILASILPLITTPYVSRVLGAANLGTYSYVATIANYFTVAAMLGFENYGSKKIASTKNNQELLQRTYSEIRLLQLIISSGVLLVYWLGIILFAKNNIMLYIIQSLALVNCLIDINWFFFGIEQFKLTVTRNLIVKLVSMVCIFLFVRTKNDLNIYAFILMMSIVISDIYLMIKVRKYVGIKVPKIRYAFYHLIPCISLFVPIIAMTLYHQMDKTMLGILSTYEQVGYYYNADKIVNIPLGIITGLGTVSLPRIVSLISEKKYDEYNKILNKSFDLVMCMCSAIAFGMLSIAKEFVPFFFGKGYEACVSLVCVLCFVMFPKAISTIIVNQILIPNNKEIQYTISVFVGAFINMFANYFLIIKWNAMGAVVATMLAEIIVCLLQILHTNSNIDVIKPLLYNIKYILFGGVMFGVVRLVAHRISWVQINILQIIIEVFSGAITYVVLCLGYWILNKDDALLPLINKIKRKRSS